MSELKPCPFCGTSNCEIVSNGHDSQFVECMFCGASGPAHENHDETTEAWNRRAQPAQAVPVLTDAEIHAADPIPQNRFDQERVEFARRVEQAVRAKMGAGVGWQPIETAPKTSKAILVYCAERKNIYTANYGKVGGFLQADGWRHFGNGGDMTEAPTHWQPLPPPPGIVGKEGA